MYKRCYIYFITIISVFTLFFVIWFLSIEQHSINFAVSEDQIVQDDKKIHDWKDTLQVFIDEGKINKSSSESYNYESLEHGNAISPLTSINVQGAKLREIKNKSDGNITIDMMYKTTNKHSILGSNLLQSVDRSKEKEYKKSIKYKMNKVYIHKEDILGRNEKYKKLLYKKSKQNIENPILRAIEKRIMKMEIAGKKQYELIKRIPFLRSSFLKRPTKHISMNKKTLHGWYNNRKYKKRKRYRHYTKQERERRLKYFISRILQDSLEDRQVLPHGNFKRVLIYSRLWGQYVWDGIPYRYVHDITRKYRCPISDCVFTYDRKNFNNSDAIIFHQPDERGKSNILNLLSRYGGRQRHQRWIFFTSESPVSYSTENDLRALDKNLFNATMTYNIQSDIFLPYGRYRKLYKNEKVPKRRNFATGKLNAAVWYVSNCNSEVRNNIVKILQQYIPIFVGGNCAKHYENQTNCWKRDTHSNIKECSSDIKRFKLYLSFESAICDDYVTEKYWENAIQNEVLPIILNGASRKEKTVIIPNSYINILDFNSLEELGEYLKFVLNNDNEYNKYFEWKRKYRMIKRQKWPYSNEVVCQVCAYVVKQNKDKVYKSMQRWWGNQKCNGNATIKANEMIEKYKEKFPFATFWYDNNAFFDDNDQDYELYETNSNAAIFD